MNLTLKELNEIYYCLSRVSKLNDTMADLKLVDELKNKICDEIDMINYESQSNDDDEDLGPEYDSAGFTEDDRIVNGQYRVISNEDADTDAKGYLSNNEYQQWWDINKDRILAEDKLNHDMQFKSSYVKQGDY